MATTTSGVFLPICLFLVVCAQLFAQGEAEAFRDCCLDDPEFELDAGLAIDAEPRKRAVMRRSSLTLDCPVVADNDVKEFGNITFQWKRDGIPIKSRLPRARVYSHPNGTLHIRKVVHRLKNAQVIADDGLYECYVTNHVGTVLAQRVNVVVASVGKKFLQEPDDQMVPLGGVGYFRCDIAASPDDLLINWHKDGSILHTNNRPKYEAEGGTLLIRNVEATDAGGYRCQVTNKAFFDIFENDVAPQWRISREGHLTVTTESTNGKSLSFLVEPQNVTEVVATETVVLQCVISGVPPPPVMWKRNSESEPDVWQVVTQSNTVTISPWGSLRIPRATVANAGTYTCSDVKETIKSLAEVRVMEVPVIEDSPQSRRYPLASVIRLECIVAGRPLPRIRWLKDGEEVMKKPFRVEFFDEALVLYQSNVQDSGYYQCLAENRAGWALSLSRIVVKVRADAPAPPYNVTAEPLTSSSVLVTWKMDSAVNLLAFTVHRDRTDGINAGTGGGDVQVVDGNHGNAVLYGLEADTEYSVVVKAYTTLGASLNSQPVFVRTFLTGFPQPVLTPVGNAAVSLNWSDFHSHHGQRQHIASYVIYYRTSDAEQAYRQEVDGTLDFYILTGLKDNSEYEIRMVASYKGDNPDFHEDAWPWKKIRTGAATSNSIITSLAADQQSANNVAVNITENSASPLYSGSKDVPTKLAAPFNLHAYPLKSDAISLQWDYPKEGILERLPVTHFMVQCQEIDSLDTSSCLEHSSISFKVSHSNNAVIRELRPYTLYNISVSAHSGDIQGPYSQSIYVQTKEDVPSRPENLQAQVLAEGAVRLHWQPPTSPNGKIQGHFILYNNNRNRPPTNATKDDHYLYDSWTEVYQQGNVTWAVVANLTQQMYFFQVKACTAAGSGAPSSLIVVHMKDTASSGLLSDQHLGILGGSVIGLTSIIITVIVIAYKQRQLRKQLERRGQLEQGKQGTSSVSMEILTPVSVVTQSAGVVQTEELEKLLPPPKTNTTATPTTTVENFHSDNDSGDSGCSSMLPPNCDDTLDQPSDQDFSPLSDGSRGRETTKTAVVVVHSTEAKNDEGTPLCGEGRELDDSVQQIETVC